MSDNPREEQAELLSQEYGTKKLTAKDAMIKPVLDKNERVVGVVTSSSLINLLQDY